MPFHKDVRAHDEDDVRGGTDDDAACFMAHHPSGPKDCHFWPKPLSSRGHMAGSNEEEEARTTDDNNP